MQGRGWQAGQKGTAEGTCGAECRSSRPAREAAGTGREGPFRCTVQGRVAREFGCHKAFPKSPAHLERIPNRHVVLCKGSNAHLGKVSHRRGNYISTAPPFSQDMEQDHSPQ